MTVAENVETLPQPRGGNYEVARFNALRHGLLSQYLLGGHISADQLKVRRGESRSLVDF